MTDESIRPEAYAGPQAASTDPTRVLVVGAGRAGSALASELAASPLDLIGVWDPEHREVPDNLAAVAVFGGSAPPRALVKRASAVLLAVPDAAISTAATVLAPEPDTVVLHLSGALAPDALGPLPPQVHGGCYHPLQSFSRRGAPGASLPPYAVAVDGDAQALRAARAIAAATGHESVRVPPEGRAAYHAAAVLASNCLVALQAVAERAMGLSGVPPEARWPLLRPLLAGTVANLDDGDFRAALTGPVVRGDAETVARNLAALAADPTAAGLYRTLGRATLELAEVELGDEAAARVRAALEGP